MRRAAPDLRRWLESRPERVIALVAHWGVLDALTQHDFENCELKSWYLDELAVRAPQEAAAVA